VCRGRTSHATKPAPVRRNGIEKPFVDRVADAKLGTRRLYDFCDARVVDVADAREDETPVRDPNQTMSKAVFRYMSELSRGERPVCRK